MAWLYDKEDKIAEVLEQKPQLEWDGLLVKTYGIPKPPPFDHPNQVTVVNWFGSEEKREHGSLEPTNTDQHNILIRDKAIQAAIHGWQGFVVDAEMYGSDPTRLPDKRLWFWSRLKIMSLWRKTVIDCLKINPNMLFGGTAFLRAEKNDVYHSVVGGVGYITTWVEFTQATYAAGWNRFAKERRDAVYKRQRRRKLDWVGGVQVSRQDSKWFDNLDRWPLGSDFWAYNAGAVLEEQSDEYLNAMMQIGKRRPVEPAPVEPVPFM